MDLFSLGFVLLILVASGGIAYAADILGKKLGKKRLSVKIGKRSLRPKHVAAIGTVVMGVMVSFLTILFVAAVSRDARRWLVEGRGLLVEQANLQSEVKDLKRERISEEGAKVEAVKQLREAQNSGRIARNEKAALGKAVEELGQKRDQLNAQLGQVRGQYAKASADLSATSRDLRSATAGLKTANFRLSETNGRLALANKKLDLTKSDLGVSRSNLWDARAKLNLALNQKLVTSFEKKKLEQEVADKQEELATREEQVESLKKTTALLVDQRNEAEGKVADAQAQFRTVTAQLDEAGQRLIDLRNLTESQNDFLSGTTYVSRTEAMTFRANEEVARVVIPANADKALAQNLLAALLRSARAEAQGRGAKAHKVGSKRYDIVEIMDRKDPRTSAIVTADDLKQAVVARAAGRLEEQVLVATSSLNAFNGETVSLDISVASNPMVYRRNETVAEARIDGSLNEDRILAQLSEFVGSRVRERAVQDRMIPRAGSASPFGEVPASDVLALVRDVKKVGRSVRVQAIAEADTRAADLLKLGFRLK